MTIGIVLVSHSSTLADGVRELVAQMAPEVTVAVAGGDDDGGIGTSFERITAAVEEAEQGDGAVVLYDLGSAKLTTEMVLEMLDPERAERVVLVDAPLVEGALAAATSITPEADVVAVAAAARAAAGAESGDDAAGSAPGDAAATPPSGGVAVSADVEGTARLRNRLGLHARPASALVRAIADVRADVQVASNGRTADARSMLALVGLAATGGDEVTISASGDGAQTAVDRIMSLIDEGFGEAEDGPGSTRPEDVPATEEERGTRDRVPLERPEFVGDTVEGQAAAPGGALGAAVALIHPEPDLNVEPPDDVDAERRRLDDAIAQARAELEESSTAPGTSAGTGQADGEAGTIFAAHRDLLSDPALVDQARRAIDSDTNAQQAWWASVSRQQRTLRDIGTPVVAARAADVVDVGHRVLRALGVPAAEFTPPAGTVVIATDVTPSQMARLHETGVAAVVTSAGSPTAHAAIIARSIGMPMVTGTGAALDSVEDGTMLLVDADSGRVTLDPDEATQGEFRDRLQAAASRRRRLREAAHEPVLRPDGTRVRIGANVATATDARAAVDNGAEEVGLLRTEFWFTDRPDVPSEDEQAEVLCEILDALDGRPAVVRTMDVGGDKRAPALGLDPVRNGFLGQRGIRWCLSHPEVFQTHLRAILRAAANRRVRIMFPFVTSVEEVRAAKAALQTAAESLNAEGLTHGACEQVGIMLEIPGAALRAGDFAGEVDFVSVGTNDLIQYLTAADRTVSDVAHLATPDEAALLSVVDMIVQASIGAGVWVGVCGEVAADPVMAAHLVHAGIAELSMSPSAIPEVKQHLRDMLSTAQEGDGGSAADSP